MSLSTVATKTSSWAVPNTTRPEVDNDVFIDREKWRVPVGDFVKVNITSAGLYDLFGVPVP